jgi:hypothetical protein
MNKCVGKLACIIQEIDGGLAHELRPSMCLGVSTKDAQAGKGFADRGQPTGPMGCAKPSKLPAACLRRKSERDLACQKNYWRQFCFSIDHI